MKDNHISLLSMPHWSTAIPDLETYLAWESGGLDLRAHPLNNLHVDAIAQEFDLLPFLIWLIIWWNNGCSWLCCIVWLLFF